MQYMNAIKNIMKVADHSTFPDLEFLDFGGGFKVPYRPDEQPVDYIEISKEITKTFARFCNDYGRLLRLKFEPGKFLTGGLIII